MIGTTGESGIQKPEFILGRGLRSKRYHKSFAEREFIAWDGESIEAASGQPLPFVLFGNSKGDSIYEDKGLSTVACLEFILRTEMEFPSAIHVGYGFGFDTNEILADLPLSSLRRIWKTKRTKYKKYRLEWYPGKWLSVGGKIDGRYYHAKIFDIFSFFGASFVSALRAYLPEDPAFDFIAEGKSRRGSFQSEDRDYLERYNGMELQWTVHLANKLRDNLKSANMEPKSWHGPGAVATTLFKRENVLSHIQRDYPTAVRDASAIAFTGGRFETFKVGRFLGPVYSYDIRSAYPWALARCPSMTRGTWEHVSGKEARRHAQENPDAFALYSITYEAPDTPTEVFKTPQPLWIRDRNGTVKYYRKVSGWYWGPEATNVATSSYATFREGWIFRHNGERPFEYIHDLYTTRARYKREGNGAHWALKLALNSQYGKLAQRVGWDEHLNLPPPFHQLEYAGYVTSYTRARLWRAMMQAGEHIVSIETDGIFATVPLEVQQSEQLGDWEASLYSGILYLQSGLYFLIEQDGSIKQKIRGLDKTSLPYNAVVEQLLLGHTKLDATTSRFVGLGISLAQPSKTWRSWVSGNDGRRVVDVNGESLSAKRRHYSFTCDACSAGLTLADGLHRTACVGPTGTTESVPHDLPWARSTYRPVAIESVDDYTV